MATKLHDEQASRDLLKAELLNRIETDQARLETAISGYERATEDLNEAESELLFKQEVLLAEETEDKTNSTATLSTLQRNRLERERQDLQDRVDEIGTRIRNFERSITVLPAAIRAAIEAMDALDIAESKTAHAERQITETTYDYNDKQFELDRNIEMLGITPDPTVGRSSVNLKPKRSERSLVDLGSRRRPRRVQIELESATGGETQNPLAAAAVDGEADLVQNRLPDRATFSGIPGQLSRSDGVEIPVENISVWATRLGPSTGLVSVCITPDKYLRAGSYEGEVFLRGQGLDPVSLRVQVTAQSRFIGWLYGLLILLPLAAFGYLWVTARLSADETPWDMRSFIDWTLENFVLLFVVGFAAVWASLQLAFNDRSWGSSLVGGAAVVGGGLVAAVTAMTAIAGKVRRKDRSTTSPRDES